MTEESKKTHQVLLPISGINLSLQSARNILWCPAYHQWTQRGGFDYRSHVRDIFLSRLARICDNGVIGPDADLRMPCISQIDFPPSMKDIQSLLVNNLFSFVEETNKSGIRLHASCYNSIESRISMCLGLNFELLFVRDNVTTIAYIDPFPPENPWSVGRKELEFLSLLLSPAKKLIADQFPKDSVITAGILNTSTMDFHPAVEDNQRLSDMLQAISSSSMGARPRDAAKRKIMKELDYGSHRR